MVIESVSNPVPLATQLVDHKVNEPSNVAAEANVVAQPNKVPKPVPEAVKVGINTNPLVSAADLESKIKALNEALVSRNQSVAFSVDAATGKDVVSVTNMTTGELIRQMPSVEALRSMQNIDQMMGLIFSKEV